VSKREQARYRVRFTEANGQYTDFIVYANTSKEAALMAKIKAGQAKIPVLECKVEVL
jgi:hypothetical protein